MSEILLRFPVQASPSAIFQAIASPKGLDCWWTLSANGTAAPNAIMQFGFGPKYQWQAGVTEFALDRSIEYSWIVADDDWTGTKRTPGFAIQRLRRKNCEFVRIQR